jgi:hypothetical protein
MQWGAELGNRPWIHADSSAMATSIAATVRDGRWDDERRLANTADSNQVE